MRGIAKVFCLVVVVGHHDAGREKNALSAFSSPPALPSVQRIDTSGTPGALCGLWVVVWMVVVGPVVCCEGEMEKKLCINTLGQQGGVGVRLPTHFLQSLSAHMPPIIFLLTLLTA